MENLRKRAIKLRLEGYSYNEISRKIGVAKSTLFSWLHDVVLPTEAMARLKLRVAQGTLNGLVKRNKMQTVLARERALNIKQQSSRDIKVLTKSDLCIIGAVLYWAEGYKRLKIMRGREVTNHMVSFTNSDPAIVAAFIAFLTRVLKVAQDRIVVTMRLFKHIDAELAIRYWMGVTNLPRTQFRKPAYPVSRSSQGKRPFNRLPYGTVQVIVSDTPLFYRVMGLIEGIKKRLHPDDF
ncbi:MAG: helix-turn-helix domain-containing protein [bacterium]|nr:helix-turn-helix domain-containing protein [bacterium]